MFVAWVGGKLRVQFSAEAAPASSVQVAVRKYFPANGAVVTAS